MANEINLKLTLDGKEANATINSVDKSIVNLKESAEISGSGFGNSWAMALTGINQGMQLLQQGLDLLSKPIMAAGQFEGYETSLKVMLGSTELAKERLKELSDFAASTPFELPQVVGLGNQLQAIGKYSKETMTNLGDLASASGKSIEQVTGAFAKLSTGQKGIAVDMFRDLLISTKDWEQAVGKSIDKITSDEMLGALPKIMKEKGFSGMMEEQSKTFNGILSNFQDSIGAIMRTIGEKILPIAKDVLSRIIPLFQFLSDNIKTISIILAGLTSAFIVHYITLKSGIIIQVSLAALEKMRIITTALQTGATLKGTLAQLGMNTALMSSVATLGLIAIAVAGLISLYTNLMGAQKNYERSARLQAYAKSDKLGFDAAKMNAEQIKEQFKDSSESELKRQIELRKKEIKKIDESTGYNGTTQDKQQIFLYQEEIKNLNQMIAEKKKVNAISKAENKKTKEQEITEELSKWKTLSELGIKGKEDYNNKVLGYYEEYNKKVRAKGEKASKEELNLLSHLHSELKGKEVESKKDLLSSLDNYYNAGLITAKEYYDSLQRLNDNYTAVILTKGKNASDEEFNNYLATKNKIVALDKEKRDKEKQAQDFYLDIVQSSTDKEIELQQSKYDKLEELKSKDLISSEQYSQAKQKLQEQETAKSLELTQQSLGTAMGLFGKHTAMYKAMAIAQATIDTYKGINASLSLPFPFNWIQGALILATGLGNVATISGIVTPNENGGFAEGGLLPQGKAGIIEGWHNEIIAPERTFIDVMNSNILPRLSGGGSGGLSSGMIERFEKAVERFERKQFKLRGTDLVMSGERVAINSI